MNFEKFKQLCDIDKTAKHYIQDLERDSSWLTDYAQDKADRQRLIEITVTMNRARWFIGELANGYNEAPSIVPSADRPQGEWIDYIGYDLGIEGQWLRDDGKTVFVQCDQCDSILVRNLMTHMNYCPNCGARMTERSE